MVAFMRTRVTNGDLEAINGPLQLAKRLARGYRTITTFSTPLHSRLGNSSSAYYLRVF
jgi:transposase